MNNTKIQWTTHTFNPWIGCMKVSDGCKNCYAEAMDNRWKGGHWGPAGTRRQMSPAYWKQPLKWDKEAAAAGQPAKVFCASMADVFEDNYDTWSELQRLFKLISCTPNLIWQLLTKRPENIMRLIPESWEGQLPSNVWIGTSVEDQASAKIRIPHLIKVPAVVRFLSCEPLLGPLDLNRVFMICKHWKANGGDPNVYGKYWWEPQGLVLAGWENPIHWVIAGGESGHGARPMHPDWVRMLRDQCAAAKVPFFFKQWGEWRQYDHYAADNTRPLGMFKDNVFSHGNIVWDHRGASVHMAKVGKKMAGRHLDGKEHNEYPKCNSYDHLNH